MRGLNRVASGLLGLILLVVGLVFALQVALVAAGRQPLVLPLNRWYRTLSDTTLANRAVLITAVVVGVVGLLILFSQVRRWAPDRLLIGTPTHASDGPPQTRTSAAEADGEAGTVSAEASATSLGMIPDEPVMVTRDRTATEAAVRPEAPAGDGTGPEAEPGDGVPWWVARRSVQRRTATAAGTVGGVVRTHATVRGRPGQWRLRVRADGPADRLDAVQRAVRSELDRLDAPADTAVDVTLRTPRGRVR